MFYLYCKSGLHVSAYDDMYILSLLEFQKSTNTVIKFCYIIHILYLFEQQNLNE